MNRRPGTTAFALAAVLALPSVALARGFGGGMHGGGFHGGGGHAGGFHGGGARVAAPHMGAPRMAAPGFHGGSATGFHGAAAGGTFHHGPSLNYSRGYSGLHPGGFRDAGLAHNFGLARQNALAGNAIGNRSFVNNRFNNWHRGYWGGYGRGGYGGLGGYGGYGGYGLGYGGFGTGLLLGSGLGLGLGGYGMGGYGGYGGYGMGGYGGYGGYGMGGYGGYGGYGAGLGTWPYTYGYSSYVNPYYSSTMGTAYSSYAQPIAEASAAPEQAVVDKATGLLDTARQSFKTGDYAAAQRQVEEALKSLPDDLDLHEFRALTLFSQARYSEAAAALYTVLSARPGWNWATLISFYPSADTFTTQLRSLEQYCAQNANAAAARFDLAYLYVTMGANDAAADALRQVVRQQPDDRLSHQLLAELSGSPPAATATGNTPAPPGPAGTPVATEPSSPLPANLTGTWKAQGAGGTTVELKLDPDGQFTWSASGQGQPRSFSGTYTIGSDLLTLVSSDGRPIVGRLAGTGGGHFQFKLVGSGPDDQGLTFGH